MTIEEKVEIKILKAVLSKSELKYAKNALDYINTLENKLKTRQHENN